ncbi:fluoride efflux transporter CrcB [Empedobacter stercoris]|uniref:Fluoride-specific ion channel FluC n=1 Tax=Empedobacter stercoris TaxID=1628248 RepID=A0ABX1WJB9_9FLAO|nr:fluoride efflux transporter CrcB [Empedobacter stercoris]MCA4776394.1 fluoride efflux transporter CrcB [Empedobacter stercoris]NOJ74641.1 fluoride efflux transporter CrcB [Empedobacter stercoris]
MNLLKSILFVGLGGAFGSVARFLISYGIGKYYSQPFPLATFLTNSIGCFLIGTLYGYSIKNGLGNTYFNFLLITGFCGGFTTFSSFSYENFNLIQQQNVMTSLVYILSSVVIGIIFTLIGFRLIK